MAQIYPSLLAAKQDHLETLVKQLEPYCPGFHIDIIDNVFAPNTGISIEKTNAIAQKTYRQLWVHLMVEQPEEYLEKLHLKPDSIVTFHIESKKDTKDLINKIIEKKLIPGIAINPKTGIDEIFPSLGLIGQVLIMSVNPGFSGQQFLEDMLTKVGPLLGYRDTKNLNFKIAMDGGINEKNLKVVTQKGVDVIGIGSAIFDAKVGPVKAYQLLCEIVG
jgi:ribulose-phosphate 3-epimerase